jgi:general secretion pathway protein K
MKAPFSSRANRGSALLLVLWATVMLSVMIMGVVQLVDFDLDDSIGRQKNARARQLAESGLALGIHPEVEFHDPVLKQTLSGAERIEVKVSSEGARLNINRLLGRNDRELLRRIFDEWGVDDSTSSQLLDCLADWADADDLKRLNGAERSDYEKRGVASAPKNRPFWSLEEMAMVSGMEKLEEVKPNWRDYFTIWGDGRLDINEASAELIQLVCEVNILQAEALVKRRWGPDGEEGTEDDLRFTDVEEVRRTLALPQTTFERIDQRITIQENVRRIESTGVVGNHRYQIILVALRNANPPQYLEWQEP